MRTEWLNEPLGRLPGIGGLSLSNATTNAEWIAFVSRLETAEEDFVQGRPASFLALWSHSDDVSLCGGFGGVERGWQNVTDRLTWVSAKYAEGTRSRNEIVSFVETEFAYIVQTEVIRSRLAGQSELSTLELRATMIFRRQSDGWRIVHRHADLQTRTRPPQ